MRAKYIRTQLSLDIYQRVDDDSKEGIIFKEEEYKIDSFEEIKVNDFFQIRPMPNFKIFETI